MIDYKEGDAIVSLAAKSCTLKDHSADELGYDDRSITGKIFKANRIFTRGEILLVDIGLPLNYCAGCFKKLRKADTDIFKLAEKPVELDKVDIFEWLERPGAFR